jgi:hypothetical protein
MDTFASPGGPGVVKPPTYSEKISTRVEYSSKNQDDEDLVDFRLPQLQMDDEIVQAMKSDFNLNEGEINKIVATRFGTFNQETYQK